MKKNIYKWHRTCSLIIAIPVLLWASSGFMHPLMTNIRPAIATQGWPAVAVDTSKIRIALPEVLKKHHLDSFANIRLVHIDTNWFYQVQPVGGRRPFAAPAGAAPQSPAIQPAVPVYISCLNGNVLPAGDWLYAQYLAKYFLEGPTIRPAQAKKEMNMVMQVSEPMHDCCGAATECVLNPGHGSKVSNVSMLSAYDNEYKSINRLLPVYRVSFDRADGIRVYVETTSDRFSFAMDNKRAVFDEIFRLFHTWGWLDFLGKGRLAVEMSFALLAFLTSLMGIYIFFSTRSVSVKNNNLVRARRNHRYTAIVAALFTLLWTFSGSYHAFSKFTDDVRDKYAANDHFAATDVSPDYARLQAAAGKPLTNISLVKIEGLAYWQVNTLSGQASGHKDLMKDGKVPLLPVCYIRMSDYTVLPDGDAAYARSLAALFSGQPASAILSTTPVTSFNDEYNFTDKRLPVWKISYASNGHQRFFIETSTGRLSSLVNDRIMAEGYSFSLLHKHHFMDWSGKSVRDLSTMVWALAQVIMILVGLVLYMRYRQRRQPLKRSV